MEQLQRKAGPFKVWQWVIIVVLGVLLGLAVRNRASSMGRVSPTPVAAPDFLPTQGASAGNAVPVDSTIITTQIARQNEVLEDIGLGQSRLFALVSELFTSKPEGSTSVKTLGPSGGGGVSFTPKSPTPISDPNAKIKDSIIASFTKVGVTPPSRDSARMTRLVNEVKAGRTYADIEYELRKYLYDQGKGANPGKDPQDFNYGG